MSPNVRQPPVICRSAASSSAISASISWRSRAIFWLVRRDAVSAARFAVTSTTQLYAAQRELGRRWASAERRRPSTDRVLLDAAAGVVAPEWLHREQGVVC